MSEATQVRPKVVFAGGGTGGHIFPNVAVAQRLADMGRPVSPHFLVSRRPLDARIMDKLGWPWTPLSAAPLSLHPVRLWRFGRSYLAAVRTCRDWLERIEPRAMVATGGFVSGPAVKAASQAGVAVALVNLDAVPGRANRWCARDAQEVFTAYGSSGLPRAQRIGVPLRREAAERVEADKARWELGLRPGVETILITAGSQGASTINRAAMELVSRAAHRRVFRGRQVLHLAGAEQREEVAQAYERAGVPARVESFCDRMGLAWSAATLAVSRAGAGSVAEAWHHAVPTIFVPYPFHRDEHQKHNAEPLVNAGGALLVKDRVDPLANVAELAGPLASLAEGEARREAMRSAAAAQRPPDGADALARWLISVGAAV